ncbi:mercuric resistance operon regulatory protein [Pseudomonas sp. SCT]|jgi:DNA-binding transcriptional MerR regulator|uniref:MerR family transcriptional regulator n=1 Tax=Pseudomonas sp. (strain SCT) TaxID=412955 RepID=UPI000EBC670D|nr:MerR family transcriptional regulator [Pseudomonas sp. SCT]GCA53940.1 mercuric resistance operon regulatory protein [Pseudomonas sp. SCT]
MSHARKDTFTLGQLAKRVGLARSSVLHYESVGLLAPYARSPAGYRLYGEPELDRLLTIRRLRESGLALADIRIILSPSDESDLRGGTGPMAILEKRLLGLTQEVERIRTQQRLIAHLLAAPDIRNRRQQWDKASWVALLRRAGFDEEAMHLWHVEFERENPDEHANFLTLLGLNPAEVAEIQCWSKAEAKSD